MPRPKWNPEPRTVRWILENAERRARQARTHAREDGKRGRYGAALAYDAQAQALEEFVRELTDPSAQGADAEAEPG